MGALSEYFKSKRNRENYREQLLQKINELSGAHRLLWCIIMNRHNGKIIITADELRKIPQIPELETNIDDVGRIHFVAKVERRRITASDDARRALA